MLIDKIAMTYLASQVRTKKLFCKQQHSVLKIGNFQHFELFESGINHLVEHDVLLVSCQNKIPCPRWLKQEKFVFSQGWRLELLGQVLAD